MKALHKKQHKSIFGLVSLSQGRTALRYMETLLTDAGAKPLILHDWYLLLFMILTGGFGETAEKPTVFRWFVLEPIPICAIITPYLTIFNSLLLEGWRKKGVIAMVVVDIRNVFAVRNVEIIEINDDFIYYAEEKKEEGHNNLFLLEYNRVSKRERVVTHYSLDDPTFVQHLFSFSDSIVLLLENGGDSVWVFRVDKNTGEETARLKIRLIGDFSDCRALDKRHILLWTTANEKYDELFAKYQEKTGNSRIAYLHDLDTAEKYLVKDRILCRLGGEDIVLYSQEGENRALLLNPYGDEAHKEKCYKNARWISQPVCDYIWDGRIAEILEELANGAEALKLKKLVTAGIEGLARYTGMDQKGVYFRARHFSTESECICRCDKATGKVEVLSQLSFDREDCYYHVDVQGCKVYRITEGEETCLVKGIVNSGVQGKYQKQLGEFVSCVEDRFLITRKVMTDSHGNYEFEYHSICDIKKKTEESFECKCVVSKNTLVLY